MRGAKRIQIENVRTTTDALAEILDISSSAVVKLIFEPIRLGGNDSGEYYLHDVLRHLWSLRKERPELPEGEVTAAEAKRLKTIEEHRKIKLANDLEEELLIEVAEVERTIRKYIEPAMREVETFLMNKLPSEAANLEAGEIRNLMTPAFNAWVEALQGLADELCKTEKQSLEL